MLNETEGKIARLIYQGYTDREIAVRLGMKLRAIQVNNILIYKKMGVKSRHQLIVKIFKESLLNSI